jgi:membrane peptidoglycan carboxypeptidase
MTVGRPAGEAGHPGVPTVGGLPSARAVPGIRPGQRPVRRRRRWVRRGVATIVALFLLGVLSLAGLLLLTPSVADAPALARAIDRAHHAAYPGPPVPSRFAASLVSTEDHRFYAEPGVDPVAVGRVILGRLTGRPDQGGATLYQQLAKMLYTSGRSGVAIEVEQVGLAIKLALTYPAPEILRMYADVAYFGNGYYGLQAASCGYFGEPPARLTWPQAALLAGLVQAPTAYDPVSHFTAARGREAHVLGRLVATGELTRVKASRAYRQPLHLSRRPAAGCAAG